MPHVSDVVPPVPVLAAPDVGSDEVPNEVPNEVPHDASHAPAPGAPDAGAEHAALAAECAALAAALRAGAAAAPPGDAERAQRKAEIVALIRAVAARARAYSALEEDAKALAALWKALPAAPAPSAPDAAGRRTTRADHLGASTYAAKGWSAYALGDFAAAEAAYAQALTLAPDDAEAAALHTWALVALGRDDDALRAAVGVLAAAPPDAAAALARVTVGRVGVRQGSTSEAFGHLTRVMRDDADRRATLYATFHLGVAHAQQGMYDEAVVLLRRALALGPNLVEAYYALGRAHWQAGSPEAAIQAWRAGAAAGKFSPWAARCEAIRLHMEAGGELPTE